MPSNASPILSPSTSTTTSTPNVRPLRSRTSTISFRIPTPLPPVISRENSGDEGTLPTLASASSSSPKAPAASDMTTTGSSLPSLTIDPTELSAHLRSSATPVSPIDLPESSIAGPSRPHSTIGRRAASKSISQTRPPLSTSANAHRALSYHPTSATFSPPSLASGPSASPNTMPIAVSPVAGPLLEQPSRRTGLKRRISTPNLDKRHLTLEPDEIPEVAGDVAAGVEEGQKPKRKVESRARSTSTSIVVPDAVVVEPTVAVPTLPSTAPAAPPSRPPISSALPTPLAGPSTQPSAVASMYNIGESTVSRVVSWVRPPVMTYDRVSSDSDSEKGLDGSEEEAESSRDGERGYGAPPSALARHGAVGRYWGLANEPTEEEGDYFSLPPTPPEEKDEDVEPWGAANSASLPTPALSAHSLSRGSSTRRHGSRPTRRSRTLDSTAGWWYGVYTRVFGTSGNGGKTAEVLRELGWTVAALAGLFVVSLGVVLFLISGMPITQLKHLPKSTTDLQLLSTEIKTYMQASNIGWWHTIFVLTLLGCWKHAWSIPGSVVLNILVGSVLDPMSSLVLLTVITACGSLGAYLLSRPLAPLIAVLFPKPLALVRAALAPESIPQPPQSHTTTDGQYITPLQVGSDPSGPTVGGAADRPNVWRRLLVMRAMGLVPWSGMNVACGVVGVDWKTFWLTTAAGSASWSYVTASVGNILSRIAVPAAALTAATATAAAVGESSVTVATQGESLTSLLRDPTLIAKLVFLTVLTLLPALLKRRPSSASSTANPILTVSAPSPPLTPPLSSSSARPHNHGGIPLLSLGGGIAVVSTSSTGNVASAQSEPMSPLAASLAKFTPVPQVFDLHSFGRTAVRQGGRVVGGVVGGARTVAVGAQKVLSGWIA